MMANLMDDDDDGSDCQKITLDLTEPHAKKILENLTDSRMLEILELVQNPSTICNICARSSLSRSKATLYKRMSELLDCGLLFAVKKENIGGEEYGSWAYAKSFHSISVKFGQTGTAGSDHPVGSTVIEILPKRNTHAQILKTMRIHSGER